MIAKKKFAACVRSVKETDWRAELELFGKGVVEDGTEAGQLVGRGLGSLPEGVASRLPRRGRSRYGAERTMLQLPLPACPHSLQAPFSALPVEQPSGPWSCPLPMSIVKHQSLLGSRSRGCCPRGLALAWRAWATTSPPALTPPPCSSASTRLRTLQQRAEQPLCTYYRPVSRP